MAASLALALRQAQASARYLAYDINPEALRTAQNLGIIDAPATAADFASCDLIIICIPVGSYASALAPLLPYLHAGQIVTDIGSVKAAVVAQVLPLLPAGVDFVPAHPVAGSEKTGPQHGRADLFVNRWCIITPLGDADYPAVRRVAELWRRLGSKIELMTPESHDNILAMTSHLPHLLAYTLIATAKSLEESRQGEVIKYSAGGFRDATRMGAHDPQMWRDIFLLNREPMLEMISRFTEDLLALQRAIRWGQGEVLFDLFTHARQVRQQVIGAKQD